MVYNSETFEKIGRMSSYLPPTLIIIQNKKFAIYSGTETNWIEVDNSVSYKQVKSKWDYQPPAFYEKPKKQKREKTWTVENSKGTGKYTITLNDGGWNCTCLAWGFRKKCRHVNKIKNSLEVK